MSSIVNHGVRDRFVRLRGLIAGFIVLGLAGCDGVSQRDTVATDQTAAHPGEKVYLQACFSCHAAGIAGAPKLGDTQAWGPRIAKGKDALVQSVVQGIPPGMPPGGACAWCSAEDYSQVIDYMISEIQ